MGGEGQARRQGEHTAHVGHATARGDGAMERGEVSEMREMREMRDKWDQGTRWPCDSARRYSGVRRWREMGEGQVGQA